MIKQKIRIGYRNFKVARPGCGSCCPLPVLSHSLAVYAQNCTTQALCISVRMVLSVSPLNSRKQVYASDQSSLKRIVLCFNVSPQFFLNFIPRMGEMMHQGRCREKAQKELRCPSSRLHLVLFAAIFSARVVTLIGGPLLPTSTSTANYVHHSPGAFIGDFNVCGGSRQIASLQCATR